MLKIHEILDRYEILFPDNENLSDLRRAYVDHDIASIFRLSPNVVSDNIDPVDIRKLALTQNIYSLFRIMPHDDLKLLLVAHELWSLWRLLEESEDTHLTEALKQLMSLQGIEFNPDCLARNQLLSKRWIIEELERLDADLGTVYICAGWYGTLALMMFESSLTLDRIRSFDIDPSTVEIARIFNRPWVIDNWQFQSVEQDICDVDYYSGKHTIIKPDGDQVPQEYAPDTVVNTSCEHIENWGRWWSKIPPGTLMVLQSNDFFSVEDHVNCSEDLEAFKMQTPFTTELYSGEKHFEQYTRFMRIGIK